MNKILIVVFIVLFGCRGVDKKYDVELIYENGDVDTVYYNSHSDPYLNGSGCIDYVTRGSVHRICGVRSFKILKKIKNIKS